MAYLNEPNMGIHDSESHSNPQIHVRGKHKGIKGAISEFFEVHLCAGCTTFLISILQNTKHRARLIHVHREKTDTRTTEVCRRFQSVDRLPLPWRCSIMYDSACEATAFFDKTLCVSNNIRCRLFQVYINSSFHKCTLCNHCENKNKQWHAPSNEGIFEFVQNVTAFLLTLCGKTGECVFTVVDLGQTRDNTISIRPALTFDTQDKHRFTMKQTDNQLCNTTHHMEDLCYRASIISALFELHIGLLGLGETPFVEKRVQLLEKQTDRLGCLLLLDLAHWYTYTGRRESNHDQLSIQETAQQDDCNVNVTECTNGITRSAFDTTDMRLMSISLQEHDSTHVSNIRSAQNLVTLSVPTKKKTGDRSDTDDHVHVIRDLTWLPMSEIPVSQVNITIANVLDPLFPQMINGQNLGPRVTMKFELLRLCTFRNFPKENKPYLIRLAGAGFYYAADGDETVCYCCGIRRRNWTENCKPMRIHRRISPNCSFLNRNSEVNVPVPSGPSEEMTRFAFLRDLMEEEEGGDSDSGYDSDVLSRRASTTQGNVTAATANPTATRQDPPINNTTNRQPPKHPHYGVLSTRQQSFVGWEGGNGQEPDVLADAGFYYAGMGDCVRCFQCGVGLRHWAHEDDPWIEHARWTLRIGCAYLVQKKGQEFVDLVRMALEVTNNEPDPESIDAPENNASSNDRNVQPSENANSQSAAERQDDIVSRGTDNVATTTNQATENQTTINQPSTSHETPNQVTPNNATRQTTNTIKGKANPGTATPKANSKAATAGGKSQSMVKRKDLSAEQKSLLEENSRLRDEKMCKVCFERDVCIVFLPCGHLVTCAECAPVLRTCPICRKTVKGTVKTYMS